MKNKSIVIAILTIAGCSIFAQVASISNNGTSANGPFPDGTWYIRVIQVDENELPIGPLSNQLVYNLVNASPSVGVTMTVTAPSNHSIRFYRSTSSFNIGDTVEYSDWACGGSLCNASSSSSVSLGNFTWRMGQTLKVELLSFTVE